MATITLMQQPSHGNHVLQIRTNPGHIVLAGLPANVGIQFTCTQAQAALAGQHSVDITYDATVPFAYQHQVIQISSIQP